MALCNVKPEAQGVLSHSVILSYSPYYHPRQLIRYIYVLNSIIGAYHIPLLDSRLGNSTSLLSYSTVQYSIVYIHTQAGDGDGNDNDNG